MRILMLAPPGAGKGTQAERLAEHFGIEHLSSGEMLRHEMASGSDLGARARAYVDRGDLVPDELVTRMVLDRAFAAAQNGGYVLDGFPRNLAQAQAAWDAARDADDVALQAVVHLEVPAAELHRRIEARAGERSDDSGTVVAHRLEVYERQTEPLLQFYREQRGILVTVNGDQTVDAVTADILAELDSIAAGT